MEVPINSLEDEGRFSEGTIGEERGVEDVERLGAEAALDVSVALVPLGGRLPNRGWRSTFRKR